LLGPVYQEPWPLLQAWGNKAFGQREFWGLLSGYGLQESSMVVLWARGNEAFGKWESWGLLADTGYQEPW
jgi:hypothetical protein